MRKIVSIIIPIFNVAPFLDVCISSVTRQKYNNLEIILIDDGSIDESGRICDKWKQKDSRIKVCHKENAGLGMARNSGLNLASGDYVSFVDGDDYISCEHISNLVECAIANNSDICYGGYTSFGKVKQIKNENILAGKTVSKPNIEKTVIPLMCGKLNPHSNDSMQMSVCMALYRRSTIENRGIRFPSERELISEDFIFNIEVLKEASRVTFCNDCGYFYRENIGSLTTRYNRNKFGLQKKFAEEIIKRTMEMGIFEHCEQRILSTFLSGVWFDIKEEQKISAKEEKKQIVNNIRAFCEDSFTNFALKKYELNNLPIDTMLIRILMKFKMANSLWIMAWIKNRLKG